MGAECQPVHEGVILLGLVCGMRWGSDAFLLGGALLWQAALLGEHSLRHALPVSQTRLCKRHLCALLLMKMAWPRCAAMA